jgi:hypothetical protein
MKPFPLRRKSIFALLLLAASFAAPLFADELKGSQSPLSQEMMKETMAQERVKAFDRAMRDVSVEEQQKFWGEYKAYAAQKSKFDVARLNLMDEYSANYLIIKPAQANDLMGRWIKLQQDELKSRIAMFKRLSKSVSPLVAIRFYQTDDYVYSAFTVQYLNRLPLFGDTPQQ